MKHIHLVFILFVGCASADIVGRDFENKGGTVRYLNEGAGFIVRRRKEDAENKMSEYCAGRPYRILSENNDDKTGAIVSTGGFVAMPISSEYTYLRFRCQ